MSAERPALTYSLQRVLIATLLVGLLLPATEVASKDTKDVASEVVWFTFYEQHRRVQFQLHGTGAMWLEFGDAWYRPGKRHGVAFVRSELAGRFDRMEARAVLQSVKSAGLTSGAWLRCDKGAEEANIGLGPAPAQASAARLDCATVDALRSTLATALGIDLAGTDLPATSLPRTLAKMDACMNYRVNFHMTQRLRRSAGGALRPAKNFRGDFQREPGRSAVNGIPFSRGRIDVDGERLPCADALLRDDLAQELDRLGAARIERAQVDLFLRGENTRATILARDISRLTIDGEAIELTGAETSLDVAVGGYDLMVSDASGVQHPLSVFWEGQNICQVLTPELWSGESAVEVEVVASRRNATSAGYRVLLQGRPGSFTLSAFVGSREVVRAPVEDALALGFISVFAGFEPRAVSASKGRSAFSWQDEPVYLCGSRFKERSAESVLPDGMPSISVTVGGAKSFTVDMGKQCLELPGKIEWESHVRSMVKRLLGLAGIEDESLLRREDPYYCSDL